MSRQLLPGRAATRPAQGAHGDRRGVAAKAAAARPATAGAPARVLRRPVVVALLVVVTLGLAALAWTLLRSPAAVPAAAVAVGIPHATTAATPTPSAVQSSAPDAPAEEGGPVRDPFAADGPLPSDVSGAPAPAAPAPGSGRATLYTAPSTLPSSLPAGGPGATRSSGVPTAPASPLPSTARPGGGGSTATVTVGPTYLGLYGWSGSRASFRVNAVPYTVSVGSTFGPGLTFTKLVKGPVQCALVAHRGATLTVCPGQVVPLT